MVALIFLTVYTGIALCKSNAMMFAIACFYFQGVSLYLSWCRRAL